MVKRQYAERLALAIASGLSVERAAGQLGISRVTAYRRWRDPSIKKRVAELRGEITDQAIGRLVDTLCEAVLTLRRLMAEADTDSVKLKAATALIENGLKAAAITQLEQRLTELESVLKARDCNVRTA
jgi:transposase-like protein